MKCALCKTEDRSEDSHVIPAFVYRWLKESSPTGFLRSPDYPNKRIQDGLKLPLLGPKCEDELSILEKKFAETVFHEVHRKGKNELAFEYDDWILSPSTNKVIYSSPLKEFWSGFNAAGVTIFGVAIIGYSLPAHDYYARQAIYSLVKNYQEEYWDEGLFGFTKSPLVLVDYRKDVKAQEEFRNNYRFVDFDKAQLKMNGFDAEAIDLLFA